MFRRGSQSANDIRSWRWPARGANGIRGSAALLAATRRQRAGQADGCRCNARAWLAPASDAGGARPRIWRVSRTSLTSVAQQALKRDPQAVIPIEPHLLALLAGDYPEAVVLDFDQPFRPRAAAALMSTGKTPP
jgi:hypothetical protein